MTNKIIVEQAFEKMYGRVVGHDVIDFKGLELHKVRIHIMDLFGSSKTGQTWKQDIEEFKKMVTQCSVLLTIPNTENGFLAVIGQNEHVTQESLAFNIELLSTII